MTERLKDEEVKTKRAKKLKLLGALFAFVFLIAIVFGIIYV